ncbi:MAG TPA: hypothetical protein VEH52_03905 [Gaiellaceae bacterium]|nr:hypothetical protein [Gaiellaceae bacterium]
MRRCLAVLAAVVVLPVSSAAARPVRSAIFFYPWYSNPTYDGAYAHWQQGDHDPPFDVSSVYFPARGAYSSGDPHVLAAQMRDIRRAGVDEVVSSWWGRGSTEDQRLPAVIAAAHHYRLKVAVQLEPYPGRSPETIAADLQYIRGLDIRDVYVYRAGDFTGDQWRSLDLSLTGLRIFAQTNHVGFAAYSGFAGFYTYDILMYGGEQFGRLCAQAHAVGLLCAPSVGPGYDALAATGDDRVKPRDDGETYDSMWSAAIDADADIVTITSYNEWSEGTQIEPAGHGGRYESYNGAYGLHGHKAEWAYIWATRRWTNVLAKR